MLYLGSDIGYFIFYHLARYRRKVVRDNLVKSFPEKSDREIKMIEKQFYHNFCDVFIEAYKMRKMQPSEMLERITVTNPELIEDLYGKGRNVLLAMQHSSNWEWFCNIMGQMIPHRSYTVYKRLKNKHFNDIVYKLRTNHTDNAQMLIEDRAAKTTIGNLKDGPVAVLLIADQSPKGAETDYWTDFLHRDTCWYTGLEKLAKKYDYSVVYAEMNREERGRYSVTFKLICENPNMIEDGFILEQYVRHVERFIQDNPDNWLWSHRRWKHSRKDKAS